eukprot:5545530-Prymnesium_polylepis.1
MTYVKATQKGGDTQCVTWEYDRYSQRASVSLANRIARVPCSDSMMARLDCDRIGPTAAEGSATVGLRLTPGAAQAAPPPPPRPAASMYDGGGERSEPRRKFAPRTLRR